MRTNRPVADSHLIAAAGRRRGKGPEVPGARVGPGPAASPPKRRRRPSVAASQQAVLVRVTLAGTFFFVLMFAAAYFVLVPPGLRSVRAVVPVVDSFMEAGAANDVTRASTLFTRDALRRGARDDVELLLSRRRLFDGYAALRVTRFAPEGGGRLGGLLGNSADDPLRAAVQARVTYTSGSTATLTARMAVEDGRWRLEGLTMIGQ